RGFGVAGHRVGAFDPLAGRRADPELVGGSGADARNEEFPDAGVVEATHLVLLAAPVVEVADDANGPGAGSPHDEEGACGAVAVDGPRPEHPPQLLMPALGEEVQIDVAGDGLRLGAHRVPPLLSRPML